MFTYKFLDPDFNLLYKTTSLAKKREAEYRFRVAGQSFSIKRVVTPISEFPVRGAITLIMVLFFAVSGFSQCDIADTAPDTFILISDEREKSVAYDLFMGENGDHYILINDIRFYVANYTINTCDFFEYKELTGLDTPKDEVVYLVGDLQTYKPMLPLRYAPDRYHQ